MKPTNPMAQLAQWKKNNTGRRKIALTNEPKIGLVNQSENSLVKNATLLKNQERLKTQQEAQSGEKRKYQRKPIIQPISL